MKQGSMYGHKGMSGAYKSTGKGGSQKAMNGKNPFAYKKMSNPKATPKKGYTL